MTIERRREENTRDESARQLLFSRKHSLSLSLLIMGAEFPQATLAPSGEVVPLYLRVPGSLLLLQHHCCYVCLSLLFLSFFSPFILLLLSLNRTCLCSHHLLAFASQDSLDLSGAKGYALPQALGLKGEPRVHRATSTSLEDMMQHLVVVLILQKRERRVTHEMRTCEDTKCHREPGGHGGRETT